MRRGEEKEGEERLTNSSVLSMRMLIFGTRKKDGQYIREKADFQGRTVFPKDPTASTGEEGDQLEVERRASPLLVLVR